MPIIKSAIKRVRQTNRRQKRNAIVKNQYKILTKQYISLLEQGKKEEAAKLYPLVQKSIDMAAKKNLIPDNTASRRKSSLAKMMEKDMLKKDPRAERKAAAEAKKAETAEKAPAKKVEKKPAAKAKAAPKKKA
ncbi:MAG TPA: 30S ribosomal protein S20 [Candidatus Gracilibacteria bacterium]